MRNKMNWTKYYIFMMSNALVFKLQLNQLPFLMCNDAREKNISKTNWTNENYFKVKMIIKGVHLSSGYESCAFLTGAKSQSAIPSKTTIVFFRFGRGGRQKSGHTN